MYSAVSSYCCRQTALCLARSDPLVSPIPSTASSSYRQIALSLARSDPLVSPIPSTASSSVLLTLESCRSPPRMPNGAASTPPQRPLPPIPTQQREITGPQPVDVSCARRLPSARLLLLPAAAEGTRG